MLPMVKFLLPYLVLAVVGVASTSDTHGRDSKCGVSRPLFKDMPKVQPVNIAQSAGKMVAGFLSHLGIPFPGYGRAQKPKAPIKLECLRPYLMNCTRWSDFAPQYPCPLECPIIARVTPFACTFTCVGSGQCHYADEHSAFANPATRLCESSSVVGCQVSREAGICLECRTGFALNGNGTSCDWVHDTSLLDLWQQVIKFRYFWGAALIVALVYLFSQLRSNALEYWELLTLGRIHHHLCKIRRSPKLHAGAPLFSIFENVHTTFIIGVGLPLYYNSLVFGIVVSVCLLLGTCLALSSSASAVFSYSSGVADASICNWALSGSIEMVTMDVRGTSRSFMERLATVTAVLYFIVLGLVLVHAKCQLWHAKWFNSRHLTMKDFALQISGLPTTLTNEDEIASFFTNACGTEVHSVSIAYDFSDREAEVEALIDRHLMYADSQARGGYPARVGITAVPGERQNPSGRTNSTFQDVMGQCREEDEKRVRAWFEPGSKSRIRTSGYAFVVFTWKDERDQALREFRLPGREPVWRDFASGTVHRLKVTVPRCEPTNINWVNLGIGQCRRCFRFFAMAVVLLIACFSLVIFLYWPYAAYFTTYLNEAGLFPRGAVMSIFGMLMALSWWIMCVTIGECVGRMKMHTVEDEYVIILVVFAHFCIAMSTFNVYLTWYYTQALWQSSGSNPFTGTAVQGAGAAMSEGPVQTLKDLRAEIDFGFQVFHMLVPGCMFTPCLVNPLNMFLLPYFRESLLLLLFGRGKSGREAERYLEPLPLGLAWDYQGHFVLPFCTILTLFIMSPAMRMTHVYLCVFSFLFYFFQRIIHLRVCKKIFFTDDKLDRVVMYVGWGLILAELAACSAYWQVRLGILSPSAVLWAILGSYCVYWPLLRCMVGMKMPMLGEDSGDMEAAAALPVGIANRDYEMHQGDLDSAAQELCYGWQNCNPVYVLKSQYRPDPSEGGKPAIFYSPGKEYLHLSPEGASRLARSGRWALNAQGISLELEGLGCMEPYALEEADGDSPYKEQKELLVTPRTRGHGVPPL